MGTRTVPEVDGDGAALRLVTRDDVERLRAEGLDDRTILEVVEVTAYFNFVNRLADGLGVALERPR